MASKIKVKNGECKAVIHHIRHGDTTTELVTRRGDFISDMLTPLISPFDFKHGDIIVITVVKVRDSDV